jgi:ABC-type multidrug transport system fused ATPase/permease subunit
LLSRFYDIQGGAILVDGHDIRKVQKDSLRPQTGHCASRYLPI